MSTSPQRVNRQHYLDVLDSLRGTEQVKVLQGIRRCGKSTILAAFREQLLAEGVAPPPKKHLLSALRRV